MYPLRKWCLRFYVVRTILGWLQLHYEDTPKDRVHTYVCFRLTFVLSFARRIISLACHPLSGHFACSAATDKLKVTTGLTSPNLPSSRSAEMLFKVNGALSIWDLSSRSNKVLMSAILVHYIVIYPTSPYLFEQMFTEVPAAVNSIAFNHNGNLIIAGCSDGALRLFGTRTTYLLHWGLHCAL